MTPNNPYTVRIGGIDVSGAVVSARVRGQLSQRPEATITLDVTLLPSRAVDLGSQITLVHASDNSPAFGGEVISATLVPRGVRMVAGSGLGLSDATVAPKLAFNLSVHEQVRSLFKEARLADDQFSIEGYDEPNREYFEAVYPIHGVSTTVRRSIGGVSFIPHEVMARHPWLAHVSLDAEMRNAFIDCDCYAVVGLVERWTSEAEVHAHRLAAEALSVLVVESRCGVLIGPEEQVTTFSRSDARVVPTIGDYALIRGVASGRGWIRHSRSSSMLSPISLERLPRFLGGPRKVLATDLRRSATSLYRAITTDDPISKNVAFWEAVEFYAGKVASTELFSKRDHKLLLRQVVKASEWSPEQRERLKLVKSWLNSPPLMWRLRRRLVEDAVPFVEVEIDQLSSLRSDRNDSVHGRSGATPMDETLRAGIGLMCRAIVFSASA